MKHTDVRNIRKEVLPNGLTVITEVMDHVRSVSVGIWIKSGSRREPAKTNGITHFIEHMLFKGTTSRTAEDIARQVDSIGGHLDAFTAKECVCYNTKVLDDHLPLAMDILGDLVLHPRFDPQDLLKERGVILEELKMDEDNPDHLVHEIFTQSFWKGHAIGRPILGTKDTIRGLDRRKLFDYYHRCYEPGNMLVSAAGNLSHRKLTDLVEKTFRELKLRKPESPGPKPATHSRIVLRHKKHLEQVHICLGVPSYPLPHERRYACYIMNTILGGGMSSRLFQNIRERQGLAYAVFSELNPCSDTGCLTIYAGTSRESANRVVESIMKEFRDLKENIVTTEELRRAKDHLKGSLMLSLESTTSRMSNLARQEIYFGRFFSLDEIAQRIENVTAEEVIAVANEFFRPQAVAVTVVGNLTGVKIGRRQLVC
jgi:predicted Zn-dependent peptidase